MRRVREEASAVTPHCSNDSLCHIGCFLRWWRDLGGRASSDCTCEYPAFGWHCLDAFVKRPPRLRPNALLAIDNVLWSGSVLDESDQSDNTVAIRELNDLVAEDERVDAVMLSISDGLTIVRKRS